MLSQIQKDFLSFFQNKYTLTKDKILYENNILNLNKKGTSLSLNKNNEPIYLTEISNEDRKIQALLHKSVMKKIMYLKYMIYLIEVLVLKAHEI